MAIQKKRYWQEDKEVKDGTETKKVSVWMCETSMYYPDTQTTPTAWVREVDASEVPADQLPKEVQP